MIITTSTYSKLTVMLCVVSLCSMLLFSTTTYAQEQEVAVAGPCVDQEDEIQCREWAWHDECDKNKEFMHVKCPKSCNICVSDEIKGCKDAFHSCPEWAEHGKWYVYKIY
jgi:hypothetical protein